MWWELREYAKALTKHWAGLATGPAVSLALLVWEQFVNQGIPNWVFTLVAATGIPVAGFLAWRDAYRKTQKPTPQVAQHIAHLIQLKEHATHKILNASMADRPEDAKTWGEWYKRFIDRLKQADLNWQQRVVAVLPQAGATPGEISRFQVLRTFKPLPSLIGAEHAELTGMVAERLQRLDDLIAILEARNSG